MENKRITLRAIDHQANGNLRQVIEQEIPATEKAVELFLRRLPFRKLAAAALMHDGVVSIEIKSK